MKRFILLAAGIISSSPLAALGADKGARTVAVTYFDNNGGQADVASLGKGLADMMITDLSNVGSLQVVERDKLNQLLDELKLSKSAFIDPRSAQKLGKGLAAEFIMTGSYLVVGEALRIDARVVEVASGKVAAGQKVEGKKAEFFSMEKELVDLLVNTLGVKLVAAETSSLHKHQTQSFEAWKSYSMGLDAKDQKNDEKANAYFKAALAADPEYAAAKTAIDRAKVLSRRESEHYIAQYEGLKKKLNPKSPNFGKKVYDMFMTLGGMDDTPTMRRRIELLTYIADNDLKPIANLSGLHYAPEAVQLLSVTIKYNQDPEVLEILPAVYEYVMTKYPDDTISRGLREGMLPVVETNIANLNKNPSQVDMIWSGMVRTFGQNPTSAGIITEREGAHHLFRLIAKKMQK